MHPYVQHTKKALQWAVIILVVTAVSASIGLWRNRFGSPLQSIVRVEAQSVYSLKVGDDTLFIACHCRQAQFISDTITKRDTLLVDWHYSSCRDSIVFQQEIKGLCVDEFSRVMVPFSSVSDTLQGDALRIMLEKALKDKSAEAERLQRQSGELAYYARTHTAIDDGYNQIMQYSECHHRRLETVLRTKTLLEHAVKNTAIALKDVQFKVNGRPMEMEYQQGVYVYLRPVSPNDIPPVADADFLWSAMCPWNQPTIPVCGVDGFGNRFHILASDTLYKGTLLSDDGSFYSGTFNASLQRHGTGFLIDEDLVKYGRWVNGRFHGETMLYTPQRIYGIDISRYQHEAHNSVTQYIRVKDKRGRWIKKARRTKRVNIDWNRLRITRLGGKAQQHAQGKIDYNVSFVFIKCTQGTTIRSNYYASDLASARRVGIPVAPYHFFSTNRKGEDQAKWFIRHARLSQATMPPMLDVEPSEAEIRKMGGDAVLHRELLTWLRKVEKSANRRPILYVSQAFIDRHLRNAPPELLAYDVWIARYSEYRPYVKLLFWQLSPYGRVEGIYGDVDINVFNGTKEDFHKWLNQ